MTSLVENFTKINQRHKYRLKVKVVCVDENNLFPVVPKNKNVKWEVKVRSGKNISGTVSPDQSGYSVILLNLPNSLTAENISFQLNSYSREISLLDGPYEVNFEQSACGKTKKKNLKETASQDGNR